MSNLLKVKKEAEALNPNIQVKCIQMDYAASSDYSAITRDAEIMSNLSFLVNNVGFFRVRKLLEDAHKIGSLH